MTTTLPHLEANLDAHRLSIEDLSALMRALDNDTSSFVSGYEPHPDRSKELLDLLWKHRYALIAEAATTVERLRKEKAENFDLQGTIDSAMAELFDVAMLTEDEARGRLLPAVRAMVQRRGAELDQLMTLMEALRPFAEYGDWLAEHGPGFNALRSPVPEDFLRAAAALKAHGRAVSGTVVLTIPLAEAGRIRLFEFLKNAGFDLPKERA